MEGEIRLICQKFFNLIYSCQDADDPDLITAFYLPDFTPGTRHSSLSHTRTGRHTHTHPHTEQEKQKRMNTVYMLKNNQEKQGGRV